MFNNCYPGEKGGKPKHLLDNIGNHVQLKVDQFEENIPKVNVQKNRQTKRGHVNDLSCPKSILTPANMKSNKQRPNAIHAN